MNKPNRKDKFDEIEKEIKLLKERVARIEDSFKVKEIEEKPSTTFM